jgi:integrase
MNAFEAAYPLGTRERLAYTLLAYTGQRCSDVVRMGPQDIDRQGVMRLTQQKTGKAVTVPVLPLIKEAIAACPTGIKTFLVSKDGEPLSAEALGQMMRETCDDIGIGHCTAHGLRHAAASRALENGAGVDYLTTVFGFTLAVAERYVQHARGDKAAQRGAQFLERTAG